MPPRDDYGGVQARRANRDAGRHLRWFSSDLQDARSITDEIAMVRQHVVHQTAERHARFDGTLRCRYAHRASRVIGKAYPLRVSAARRRPEPAAQRQNASDRAISVSARSWCEVKAAGASGAFSL